MLVQSAIPGLSKFLEAGSSRAESVGPNFEVRNPANLQSVATVRSHTVESARLAVARAEYAFAEWKRSLAQERSRILRAWGAAMREHIELLATVVTSEQGKPLRESRAEVHYAASYFDWFAEEARRAYGSVIPSHAKDKRLTVELEPVGVCAAVTPWNFPLAMAARKIAPALAAGCTMVLKPSEYTPVSALLMAELGHQAGVPRDALITLAANEANGIEIMKFVCESNAVRKLSFTGSTQVGKILATQCASTVKRLSLELGGNAPFVVFDDADLDAAVQGAMDSKFRNAGQTCVCANRFLVQTGAQSRFTQRLLNAVQKLRVGPGHVDANDMGPLIHHRSVERVQQLVREAEACGAMVVTEVDLPLSPGGCFFPPMVMSGVRSDMRISSEEIFGPVVAIQTFDTEAQAIQMANGTPYGLAAYIYSNDVHRTRRVSEALEFGMVGANTGLISTEVAPFGGTKQSGFGREGGAEGMAEYLTSKYICSGIQPAVVV